MKRLVPCKSKTEAELQSQIINEKLRNEKKVYNETCRILLLGTGESGKTTILKQMKIMYINKYLINNRDEIKRKIEAIRHNSHECIYTILANMQPLEIEYENSENIVRADYILKMNMCLPEIYNTAKYIQSVLLLWSDNGVQTCYKRSNEYQLLDCAKFFLGKLETIFSDDYEPSVKDLLYSRETTKCITEFSFSEKQSRIKTQHYVMIDVGGQKGCRDKWIQCFAGIHVILFIISCAEFDQTTRESKNVNRLKDSLDVFQCIWCNRFLHRTSIMTFLNKQDILMSKIRNGAKIEKYFPKYLNYEIDISEDDPTVPHEFQKTRCFIRNLIQEITKSPRAVITKCSNIKDLNENLEYNRSYVRNETYFHFTVATDTDNIRTVFYTCKDVIFSNNLHKFPII